MRFLGLGNGLNEAFREGKNTCSETESIEEEAGGSVLTHGRRRTRSEASLAEPNQPANKKIKGLPSKIDKQYSPTEAEKICCNNSKRKLAALRYWYKHLNHLIAYWNEFGNFKVSQKYTVKHDGAKLGAWVNKQRVSTSFTMHLFRFLYLYTLSRVSPILFLPQGEQEKI